MHANGHIGLTLGVLSFSMIPIGVNDQAVVFIVIAAAFSTLPDVDLKWEIAHRKYTHNLPFGLVMGALFGVPVMAGGHLGFGVTLFLGVFAGTATHLLGDMIAGLRPNGEPWPVKPFAPFNDFEIGFGWFKSSDRKMNQNFMTLGAVALVAYFLLPSLM